MDGLDLLKQHWNKNNDFPKVDKDKIRTMLHKSSSSIVKWIFLISVIELGIGLLLNLCFAHSGKQSAFLTGMDWGFEVVFYIVICYFIFNFFKAYRRITNTASTKNLLQSIINTRKHVENYIKFNIYYLFLILAFSTFITIWQNIMPHQHESSFVQEIIIFLALMALFSVLIYTAMRLYYKYIYISLLRKLDNNYKELIKLEED